MSNRIDHEKLNRNSKTKKSKATGPVKAAGLGDSWVNLNSKYDGKCKLCPNPILIGQKVLWNKHTKETYHRLCLMQMLNGNKKLPPEPPKPKPGPMKKGYQIPLHKRV